jgi:short-subunit dehydrogenase
MILQNKNVLITGATGGLGAALAKAFLKQGSNLLLTGRNKNKLQSLQEKLSDTSINLFNSEVSYDVCDLEDYNSIRLFSERTKNNLKQIDVLVNCAGVFQINSMKETSIEEYERCIKVNLTAPFVLTKEFSKEMAANNWGRVVNIASSSAYGAAAGTSVYSASKHALLGLSRALYKELKSSGVRVLCVSPGTIKTPMGEEVTKLGQNYDTFMDVDEVAEYVVYNTAFDGNLISEEIRLNRVHVQ